jgi:peptidyl-prolyl cis-trans isomerase A (cyclophilin A)/peptidyl-prolyl cis-trans isomerase B (cyclophilin B)
MKLLAALACTLLLSAGVHAANPKVELATSLGPITLELYADKAPKTVANFLQYVNDGFYDGTIFHRVIPGFMIQGGGFTAEFEQKTTREPIENEAVNGLKNRVGTIAMARTQHPHSATAQFFINVADNAFLDHTAPSTRGYGYAVFGRVVDGMEVVNRIAAARTGAGGPFPKDVPQKTILISRARILGDGQ